MVDEVGGCRMLEGVPQVVCRRVMLEPGLPHLYGIADTIQCKKHNSVNHSSNLV